MITFESEDAGVAAAYYGRIIALLLGLNYDTDLLRNRRRRTHLTTRVQQCYIDVYAVACDRSKWVQRTQHRRTIVQAECWYFQQAALERCCCYCCCC